MKILVVGDEGQLVACKKKFGGTNDVTHCSNHQDAKKIMRTQDLVIDFMLVGSKAGLSFYADHPKVTLLINTVAASLHELKSQSAISIENLIIGFNGLPTFFERDLWEITTLDTKKAAGLMESLNQPYALTDDRVGMVTPRVVCMIINEAYFTLQEGTATREDIDMAMKLGTNYPLGPFEWCDAMGISNVYELLSAIYDDTKDERYKICPLLKKEYLRSITPQ